jgi:hypothetical protein
MLKRRNGYMTWSKDICNSHDLHFEQIGIWCIWDNIWKHKLLSSVVSVLLIIVSVIEFRTIQPYIRDSAVSITTGYGLDDQGVGSSSPAGGKNFHFSMSTRPALGVHPASYPIGTGGSFPGVKRPGPEADKSPPTSTEIKKIWICTSTPPYDFMA